MKEIKLQYTDKVALVDDEDFEVLNQWKWYQTKNRNRITYAYRTVRADGTQTKIQMHRFIMNPPMEMFVDHRDHDGLNNQRSNLRVCTRIQNAQNRRTATTLMSSKYKGVCLLKHAPKTGDYKYGYWRAYITINGKCRTIGYFKTQEEAALAYNEYALKYFGEFAKLNVIE